LAVCVLGALAGLGLGLTASLNKVLIALVAFQTLVILYLTTASADTKAGLWGLVPAGAALVLNLLCLLDLVRLAILKGQWGEKWLRRSLPFTALLVFLSVTPMIFIDSRVRLLSVLISYGFFVLPPALIAAAFWFQRPAAPAAAQEGPAPLEEIPSSTPAGNGEDAEK